jgi:hypothetical protein
MVSTSNHHLLTKKTATSSSGLSSTMPVNKGHTGVILVFYATG